MFWLGEGLLKASNRNFTFIQISVLNFVKIYYSTLLAIRALSWQLTCNKWAYKLRLGLTVSILKLIILENTENKKSTRKKNVLIDHNANITNILTGISL